ncbi:Polyprenol monophosphomannose synthase (PPM synthase) (Polyprenol-P-Man synthase) (Ppm1) (Dolichol-phosphate mannose synthase) [Durusdinium trenchii]|uniref:Dolichol-phosphate mannosyltransferase subunit 1 n=1 Tax=Durusdinium trenchii TaxID=1381693 RepID=A0ABP0JM05_9DINO
MPTSPRLLITLCTYNERENILQLIPEIHGVLPDAHVLVIDDASPDGTGKLVDEMAAQDDRIHALHRSGKLGLGTATIAGFEYGIREGYDLLLNMDADFSHPPRFLPSLVEACDQADVVIASRYVPGGAVVGWGPLRHIMSRGINIYARTMLGLTTRDNSGSFRLYSVAKLAEVDWQQSRAKGYAFEEEILFRLKNVGCTFVEVPFQFEERRFGETKINTQEALSALTILAQLGFERLRPRRSPTGSQENESNT